MPAEPAFLQIRSTPFLSISRPSSWEIRKPEICWGAVIWKAPALHRIMKRPLPASRKPPKPENRPHSIIWLTVISMVWARRPIFRLL